MGRGLHGGDVKSAVAKQSVASCDSRPVALVAVISRSDHGSDVDSAVASYERQCGGVSQEVGRWHRARIVLPLHMLFLVEPPVPSPPINIISASVQCGEG